MEEIECRSCHKIKPRSEVYRHYSKRWGGKLYEYFICYVCVRKKNKSYYLRNRERMDFFRREAVKRNQAFNPEKMIARNMVNNWVRHGKIVKPKNCEKCGRVRYVQAHHEDYSQPLKVKWLCKECHYLIHRKQKHE